MTYPELESLPHTVDLLAFGLSKPWHTSSWESAKNRRFKPNSKQRKLKKSGVCEEFASEILLITEIQSWIIVKSADNRHLEASYRIHSWLLRMYEKLAVSVIG